MQSHAPGDRPAPPLQGRTNKTAALDPAPTDPSWPVPAADRVNVRESLFAEAFNRLLQQNLQTADSCTAANSIAIRSPGVANWRPPEHAPQTDGASCCRAKMPDR